MAGLLLDDRELEACAAAATEQWFSAKTLSGLETNGANETGPARLLRAYDLARTARALHARHFVRIALQFPDALLPHSFFVCAALEEAIRMLASGDDGGADEAPLVFVLGDTSYGECCVDEVAAQHLNADVVVHYGNACLSPTRALPVMYVFPQLWGGDLCGAAGDELGAERLKAQVERVSALCPAVERVVVLYDIELERCIQRRKGEVEQQASRAVVAVPRFDVTGIIEPRGDANESGSVERGTKSTTCCGNGDATLEGDCMRESGNVKSASAETGSAESSELEIPRCSDETAVVCGPLSFPSGRSAALDDGDAAGESNLRTTAFLWLSREGSPSDLCIPLRNAALQYCPSTCAGFYVAAVNAGAHSVEPVSTGRLLGKRYALVDKARDAERVGIVAGTLGVSGNLAVIERVKKVVEAAGRRWYMLMVGKPNAAKLGNFAEMDVFVLVACAQNSLIDSKDYLRPVVTPFEIEVALGGRDWFSSMYSPDFADVLRMPPLAPDGEELSLDAEEGRPDGAGPGLEVAPRGDWTVSVGGAGAAAGFLAAREWRGLDARLDGDGNALEALPTRAVDGRAGVAGGYAGEG